MKRNVVDRRVLVITRVVLFAIGAVIGWVCMWQYLTAFPHIVRDELKIVFEIIAAAVVAFALMLSSRAVVWLVRVVWSACVRLSKRLKPLEAVGIALGIVVGMMIAFLSYVLMNLFIPYMALRIVLAIAIGATACVFSSIAMARALTAPPDEDEGAVSERRYNGLILHSSAFRTERLPRALEWVDGTVYVTTRTVKTLIDHMDDGADALTRYKTLSGQELFRQIEASDADEDEAVVRIALTKRLKIVVCGASGFEDNPLVKVLDLNSL